MADTPDIWSVSRLNREVKHLLEGTLPVLWVEGELTNLARPASGHWYFTLKDASAQVRCAMFRQHASRVRFAPAAGVQVLVRARVSLYETRGDYQLIAEHMEESGHGVLQREFEALKAKLTAEGLFDASRKRPLPRLPRCIGIITSPTGAAIRDILSVLARRFPAIPVVVYPVPVQGEDAAARITAAIGLAADRGEADVLIITRGGGSIEDLQAFNDETLARAIRACPIPVISGVGHEIDFTIADFVSDHRAPTPSAAAELVVPDCRELSASVERSAQSMTRAWTRQVAERRAHLRWLFARLKPMHPGVRLEGRAQRLDDLSGRLNAAWRRRHERASNQLAGAARALNTVSPLATLARGYAIVTGAGDGRPVTESSSLRQGDQVRTLLHHGGFISVVEKVEK